MSSVGPAAAIAATRLRPLVVAVSGLIALTAAAKRTAPDGVPALEGGAVEAASYWPPRLFPFTLA